MSADVVQGEPIYGGEFAHCKLCGSELSRKRQQNFRSRYKYYLRRDGRRMDGPFCDNFCRARWMSRRADQRLSSMEDVGYGW